MFELDHEKRHLHIFVTPNIGTLMSRKEHAKWLSRYWKKFVASNAIHSRQICSLTRAEQLTSDFVVFLSKNKTAIAYLEKNEVSNKDLEKDARIYAINKIWQWKADNGAIVDQNCALAAMMSANIRKARVLMHQALGLEFKLLAAELKAAKIAFPKTFKAKDCVEILEAFPQRMSLGLEQAIADETTPEIMALFLPELSTENNIEEAA